MDRTMFFMLETPSFNERILGGTRLGPCTSRQAGKRMCECNAGFVILSTQRQNPYFADVAVERTASPSLLTLWDLLRSPRSLGALANPLSMSFHELATLSGSHRQRLPNFRLRVCEQSARHSLPFRERYDPDAPILRTLDPAYQASIQQASMATLSSQA